MPPEAVPTSSRIGRTRHVVVLAARSGGSALEQALVAAGHRVSLLTIRPRPGAPARTIPGTRVYHVDSWTDVEALGRVDQSIGGSVDAVVTVEEAAVPAAAWLRCRRGLPGLSPADADAYTDKAAMKNCLAAAGVPVARHLVVRRADQLPAAVEALGGWPVVIKPRRGAGSWNVHLIRAPARLRELVEHGAFDQPVPDITGRFAGSDLVSSLHASPNGFLVEQCIDVHTEYWVDLYRAPDGSTLLAAPGRYSAPLLSTVGDGQAYDTLLPPDDVEAQHAVRHAEQAARALGVSAGAVHLELLRTVDGAWFVSDAAARPGGGAIGALTSLQFGVDLPAALASLAVDEEPAWRPQQRYRALTALVVSPPPGIVDSVASVGEIAARPGVVAVDLRLAPGKPVPPRVGSVSLAGHVIFEPNSVAREELAAETAELQAALRIKVHSAEEHAVASSTRLGAA